MPLYPPEFFLEIPDETDPYEEINLDDGTGRAAEVVSLDTARVRKFVKRLPKREREVMRLRYGFGGRGYTIDEVARKLRISVGSVCGAERAAMNRLRAMYGIEDIGEPEQPVPISAAARGAMALRGGALRTAA
jgi:DNA-directed RNA polymerase specialized sigma24 family protein